MSQNRHYPRCHSVNDRLPTFYTRLTFQHGFPLQLLSDQVPPVQRGYPQSRCSSTRRPTCVEVPIPPIDEWPHRTPQQDPQVGDCRLH